NAPLEGKSAFSNKNPSINVIEAYVGKRQKGNLDDYVEVENYAEVNEENANKDDKARKLVKKKRSKPVELLIISNIQPYSILTNLQSKKADITYAQLFQAAPNIRKDMFRVL
ncbi:12437_t:CDS:1, partial [Gigaspora margarita]